MKTKELIKVAIVGYGNLGKGALGAISKQQDMELIGVFSKRDINIPNVKVMNNNEIENYKEIIDVLLLCGGSSSDLVKDSPKLAKDFNIIDSYDNHKTIKQHFNLVDKAAESGDKLALISVGWDPGLFSLNRALALAIMPLGSTHTFWGRGLSQGHSEAIKRIDEVKLAAQYTLPNDEMLKRARIDYNASFKPHETHKRDCYVVIQGMEGRTKEEIKQQQERIKMEIKNMPSYFKDYETSVNFISEEEFNAKHHLMPHAGRVVRSGVSYSGANFLYEFLLNVGSNPEFTASVLVAYARAVHRMYKMGMRGARTILDVAPAWLLPTSDELDQTNLFELI